MSRVSSGVLQRRDKDVLSLLLMGTSPGDSNQPQAILGQN